MSTGVRDYSRDSGLPFLGRNESTLHVLLKAALDPSLSLDATNAACRFLRELERLLQIQLDQIFEQSG